MWVVAFSRSARARATRSICAKESGFIERRRTRGLCHLRFRLLHTVKPRHQRGTVLVKDGVHPGLLIGTQLQALDVPFVVPPTLSRRAKLQGRPAAGLPVAGRVAPAAGADLPADEAHRGWERRPETAGLHSATSTRTTAARRRAASTAALREGSRGHTDRQADASDDGTRESTLAASG